MEEGGQFHTYPTLTLEKKHPISTRQQDAWHVVTFFFRMRSSFYIASHCTDVKMMNVVLRHKVH
jgi:hypothetical protein